MSVNANIPDLDHECEFLAGTGPNAEDLSPEEIVERFAENEDEYGLQLRYWEKGEGEWFWYIKRDADVFAGFEPEHGATDTLEDVDDLEMIVEQAEDVNLVPIKRLPKWGDWSSSQRCASCRGALREQDSVETRRGLVHDACNG